MVKTAPFIELDYIRIRSDANSADGGTPTWETGQNSGCWVVDTSGGDVDIRIRAVVSNTGDATYTGSILGAFWQNLNSGNDGDFFEDTDRTNGVLSAPFENDGTVHGSGDTVSDSISTGNFVLSAGQGTAAAGEMFCGDTTSASLSLAAGSYAEVDISFIIDSDAVRPSVWRLTCANGNAKMDAYNNEPVVQVLLLPSGPEATLGNFGAIRSMDGACGAALDSNDSNTTLGLTTSGTACETAKINVLAGDLVVLYICDRATGTSGPADGGLSVTDNSSNSYSYHTYDGTSNGNVSLAYCIATEDNAALQANASWTNAVSGDDGGWQFMAFEGPFESATPDDTDDNSTASGGSVYTTSANIGTFSGTDVLVLSFLSSVNTDETILDTGSMVRLSDIWSSTGANAVGMCVGIELRTATTAYSPTLNSTSTRAATHSALAWVEGTSGDTITVPLYTNTNTFYAPTVTPGAVSATAPLYTNTNTFYAPTVQGVNPVSVALYTNTNTFYAPTVTPGTATVSPALYTNTNTFYAPTVTPGAVTVSPALYTNTNTIYAPTVAERVTVSVALYTNTNTFYAPTVTSVSTVAPALHTNVSTFHAPTVSSPEETVSPSLFTNTNTFYSPTVTPGGVTVAPALYTNTNTFYSPTVSPGALTVSPALYTNTNTFYAPTVSPGTATVSPALYTNTNTFYAPTVTPGAVSVSASLYTNTNTFYAPTVTGNNPVAPALYTNTNTFYAPTVTTVATVSPALFTNTNTFYAPTVTRDVDVSLYTNTNTFYGPTVTPGTVTKAIPLYTNTSVIYTVSVTSYKPEITDTEDDLQLPVDVVLAGQQLDPKRTVYTKEEGPKIAGTRGRMLKSAVRRLGGLKSGFTVTTNKKGHD